MKFFALENLSSHNVTICDPTTASPAPTYPATKTQYRAWCADPKTKHCFYSAVEGLVPSLRVSAANPPNLMYGLVVDYDCPVDDAMIAKIAINGAAGLLPMWVSRTYSNHRRLLPRMSRARLRGRSGADPRGLTHVRADCVRIPPPQRNFNPLLSPVNHPTVDTQLTL